MVPVTEEIVGAIRVITIDGEFDGNSSAEVAATLTEAAAGPDRPLVIDLAGCELIDSIGLATLLHGAKPIHNGHSPVGLVCAPDGPGQVRVLLELTAIDRTLPVYWSREEAIAALVRPA
jgi:anti-anti-sigma factor